MRPSGINQEPVSNLFLIKIKHVLVITTVDIDQTEGEVMLSNNRAVEVAQITPKRRAYAVRVPQPPHLIAPLIG